jgi:hypothetical protein
MARHTLSTSVVDVKIYTFGVENSWGGGTLTKPRWNWKTKVRDAYDNFIL